MITVKDVINKYLGIPYKHKGRTLDGLDCYGLIILIYKDLGYELIDVENYPVNWSSRKMNLMLLNYSKQWERVVKSSLFDCVLLNKGDIVNHGGVMLNNYDFIHCCRSGVIISSINSSAIYGNIHGFYRFKGQK